MVPKYETADLPNVGNVGGNMILGARVEIRFRSQNWRFDTAQSLPEKKTRT